MGMALVSAEQNRSEVPDATKIKRLISILTAMTTKLKYSK